MPDLIDDGTWREAALARTSEVFVTNRGSSPHVYADGEGAPLRHRLDRASPGRTSAVFDFYIRPKMLKATERPTLAQK